MIISHFPADSDFEHAIGVRSGGTWWPNCVVHATGRGVAYPQRRGPLSIKCAFGGREYYRVDGATLVADTTGFVVLNDGQRYESEIRGETRVESFCLFFNATFVGDVLAPLVLPDDRLLDPPASGIDIPITFVDRRYEYSPDMSRRILGFRRAIIERGNDAVWFEEQMASALIGLLGMHRAIRNDMSALQAIRPAARVELYRRLWRARDLIESSFSEPLTVAYIADAARLSTHHFLRRYKQLFSETPHRTLQRRRLQEACALLRSESMTIAEVCRAVGFESHGSFTSLFGRVFGMPPERWRTTDDNLKKAILEK